METSYLMQRSRSRPLSDGLDFVFIHMDAMGRDHIPQKDYLGCESDTSQGSIQLLLSQDTQHMLEMASMFFLPLAIH